MLFISMANFFVALVMGFWLVFAPDSMSYSQRLQTNTPNLIAPRARPKPLVGIVVGHAGFGPGAVCPDGLTEVEINTAIAGEVARMLNNQGIKTDLLEEFDSRLIGYEAEALVSIHADSCNVPGATGFKVARVTISAIPEAEDRLVECLITEYAKLTKLPEHVASITDGMTNYHAFREIASLTPGAIIETGFMLEDRAILERNPKLIANGIATGILCFLKQTDNG